MHCPGRYMVAGLPLTLLLSLGALGNLAAQSAGDILDIALTGGRVVDPASGLDATRNVGVRAGKIAAVTTRSLKARDTVDVHGLVVAPGFIDLHSHGQDEDSYGFYARDGVTTALELELGTYPVAPWYQAREGKARVNFGVSVGHPGARRAVVQADSSREGASIIFEDGPWVRTAIEPSRLGELETRLQAGLCEGALGVGMGIAYTRAASREEVLRVFGVAARSRVPVFVHMRYGGLLEPGGSVDALQELLADAAATGAALHVVHITSMGLARTPLLLQMIDGARHRGLDVTTEAYPYTATLTAIQSAVYDSGWQARMGITFGDLLWPATGERLSERTFNKYRKLGGSVIAFMIPDSVVSLAIRHPLVMIASDAGGRASGHPRLAGTHARVLGHFVREQGALSLMDAIRKLSLMPAQRLERAVPEMRQKGRVRVGADADLTVFDPSLVADRATYKDPTQYSTGIIHVLVNGTFVVRDANLVKGVAPGRPVRRPLCTHHGSPL